MICAKPHAPDNLSGHGQSHHQYNIAERAHKVVKKAWAYFHMAAGVEAGNCEPRGRLADKRSIKHHSTGVESAELTGQLPKRRHEAWWPVPNCEDGTHTQHTLQW